MAPAITDTISQICAGLLSLSLVLVVVGVVVLGMDEMPSDEEVLMGSLCRIPRKSVGAMAKGGDNGLLVVVAGWGLEPRCSDEEAFAAVLEVYKDING